MEISEREERQKRITKERRENHINSVKPNYVLNFIDIPDTEKRFNYLKMYLYTEKQVQPPSHMYSYMEQRKAYMELGEVFLVCEKGLVLKMMEASE